MSNICLTFDFVLMGVVIYFAIYRFHFDSVDRPFWLLDPKYFFLAIHMQCTTNKLYGSQAYFNVIESNPNGDYK